MTNTKQNLVKKLVELPESEWKRLEQKGYIFHKGRFSGVTFLKYNLGFNTIVSNLSKGQKKKLLLLLFNSFFKIDSSSAKELSEQLKSSNTKLSNFFDWYAVSTSEATTEEAVVLE